MTQALIAQERLNYHKLLLENILSIDSSGIPSNADSSSKLSIKIASGIIQQFPTELKDRSAGQTSGKKFEECNMSFLQNTFLRLKNLRPGAWEIVNTGNRNSLKTYDFAQYEHLKYLTELTKNDVTLASSLGNDYMVSPDVVIFRGLCSDEEINENIKLVDDKTCLGADLRKVNGGKAILHASISAKWTIRSDRAQNSRTEALNLIRNRKGHLPHIVVVTGEPLPSRLASLALGTGDIDCMYHFALYELTKAVKESENEEAIRMLNILLEGKRLKDISDLPLDLSV